MRIDRSRVAAALGGVVLGLGCTAGPAQITPSTADAGDDSSGLPPEPGSQVTYSTPLAGLTGQDAFPVYSAADQATLDPHSLSFILSDGPQCFAAELDGGTPPAAAVVHWLSADIRSLDGGDVLPGTYPVGVSADGNVDTGVELSTFASDGGPSNTLVGESGSVTVGGLDGGAMSGSFNVIFDDTYAQDPLILTGSFSARSCTEE